MLWRRKGRVGKKQQQQQQNKQTNKKTERKTEEEKRNNQRKKKEKRKKERKKKKGGGGGRGELEGGGGVIKITGFFCRQDVSKSFRGSPRTSPGNRQTTEAGVVWPRHEARHPLQNHHARHRRGRTQTRETTKEPVRQRQGLDGGDLPTPPGDGRQQNSLEEDGCFFCPQVPQVPPTTA